MTRYILRKSEMPDRVLYVSKRIDSNEWCWIVRQLPIAGKDRHYPNLDYDTGRYYQYPHSLDPCRTAEEMQEKLDEYAKKYRLPVYEEKRASSGVYD
ncbi:MAG: hypothetical protein FWE95_09590 [Planctomycetaceae bacterium]|nr:hypothetical protein [Planctomycetaceae bacterium]